MNNSNLIAQYKFDKYLYENLIPEFNEEFKYYTYEDSSIMDGFVTRKLYAAKNDFVDISKCISRDKETYNSGIYAGTDIIASAPMFLDNEILFRGHEWDSLNIDLSDYQGKEINISFTIEHFANQLSELNVGIELYDNITLDGYDRAIYEDYLSENLIKEYSVTWTIPNEKCRLRLGGMYLELSNINIMIEDYNLFPNHILTEYDYINSLGFKVNKPSLYDNKLAFSHYWNGFNIECEQFKGKEVTISFDIEEIANAYDYSKCEINIPQTIIIPLNDHYSNTFIIESDYIYIGGNGIKITNLQILVDNRINIENDSNTLIPPPEIIDDIIQYPCSEWEVATFDLSEYAGKNVNISFTITAKTETWCEFGINKMGLYETICAIWEPDSAIKIFDYNTTIENIPNNSKLVLEGMNGIVSNINIIVEGENLFPSKLITEYRLYENMNCYTTTPVLHDDNTLEFTNHWRGLYVNIQDYKNMNLNVSFDIKGIPNDIGWSEFEYGFFNNNEQNYDTIEYHIFYDTLTEESSYHVEFDAMVTENTHFYLGGMGGHVENLKILADNNLPTKIRFSTATPESTGLDGREKALLEVLYLDNRSLRTEEQMFQMCINLTKVEGFVSNIMHKINHMFVSCYNLTTLDVSNWDTSNVRHMQYMFYDCPNLTTLDVSNWDTINVTDMRYMFYNCYNLTTLDVSNWDTSNITNMESMFENCNNLTTLDLSNFDTSNVTGMKKIFADCHNLSALDLTNWDTSKVTDFIWLFTRCYNLTSVGNISNWDTSTVDCFDSMFFECYKLTELDLSNWNTNSVTYIENIFTEAAINKIIMNNSDYNSVNKIITQLPTKTSDSMGILNIVGIGDISQIDKNTADSKYWKILIRTKYNVKADKRFKNIKVGNRRVKKISLGSDVYL